MISISSRHTATRTRYASASERVNHFSIVVIETADHFVHIPRRGINTRVLKFLVAFAVGWIDQFPQVLARIETVVLRAVFLFRLAAAGDGVSILPMGAVQTPEGFRVDGTRVRVASTANRIEEEPFSFTPDFHHCRAHVLDTFAVERVDETSRQKTFPSVHTMIMFIIRTVDQR